MAPVTASLASDGRRVYVPSVGRLAALSLDDGRLLWSIAVPGQLDNAPTVAGDLVYLGQRNGQVVAVEATSGRARWSQTIGDWVRGSPIVADGVVYAVSGQSLVGLDAESGSILWRRNVEAYVGGRVVVTDHEVVVPTDQEMVILDRRTGRQTFWFVIPNAKTVVFHDDTLIALSTRVMVVFEPDSRRPWWEPFRVFWLNSHMMGFAPELPAPPHRWFVAITPDSFPPTFGPDDLHVASASGTIRARNRQTGRLVWERRGDPLAAPPILTAAGLLALERNALLMLDPLTGDQIVRREFPGAQFRDMILTEAAIVLATGSGEILLLRR